MEGDRDAVDGATDMGGCKLGLAECGDMDRQLAQVASAKCGDIPVGLLDEIFQCIYFLDMLGVRRVCKHWYSEISRGSAPFQRNVVISTDFLRSDQRKMPFHKFWLLVEEATTLIVCGESEEGRPDHAAKFGDWTTLISKLWDAYTKGNMSHRRISKVIYANMVIRSSVFRCSAVLQLGFQTIVYHSTLVLKAIVHFKPRRGDEAVEDHPAVPSSFEMVVEVVGPDSYSLEEMGEYSKLAPVNPNNPVAEHFARMNCSHLTDYQLASLTNSRVLKDLGSAGAVRKLMQQLINRFDRGNEGALSLFDKGDVIGFAKEAHPLVSAFLHGIVVHKARLYRQYMDNFNPE